MPTQKYYSQEFIDRLIEQMEALPPYERTERSKQQLVAELAPVIASLRDKGYTWEAVAQVVTSNGVPISAAVLRTYLRRSQKQQPARTPKEARGRRRRRSG